MLDRAPLEFIMVDITADRAGTFAPSDRGWQAYCDVVANALREAGWGECPVGWQPAVPRAAIADPAAPAERRYPFPFVYGGPIDDNRWRAAAERAMQLADLAGLGYESGGPAGGRWVTPSPEPLPPAV